MSKVKISEEISQNRRSFLGTAAKSIAVAHLGITAFADAAPAEAKPSGAVAPSPAANTSFGPLKQINAGLLSVGYAEAGPADGPPVILLHGWPYDIHSYVDVAPILASKSYRVIIPHTRGYGTTRFLSSGTFRNGQPVAGALDITAFMDALNIKKARKKFSGKYAHRTITGGVGHNLPQEAPEAFAKAIVDVDAFARP